MKELKELPPKRTGDSRKLPIFDEKRKQKIRDCAFATFAGRSGKWRIRMAAAAVALLLAHARRRAIHPILALQQSS